MAPKNDASGVQNEAWMAYVTNAWSRTVAQPFLIAAMTSALAAGPLVVLQVAAPVVSWQAFIPFIFFVALEGVYTAVWLARPNQRVLNKTAYRVAEFVVIAIIVRLLAWWISGVWPTLADWETYLFEPFRFFFEPFFLAAIVLVFLMWQYAIYTGAMFAALSLDTAEAAYYADAFGKGKLENRPIITNRGTLISGFVQRWMWGGLALVVLAALSTIDLLAQRNDWSFVTIARLPMPPLMLSALMVYFLAGFLLLSQGRLALLNARWLINGVTKGEQVERSWYRYSLRLLVIIGFVAALLPLGSTIGLSRIVAAIVSGVTAVAGFILLVFLALLAWLLPGQSPDTAVTPAPPLPTLVPATPPPPLSPTDAGETASMVFSSAFWAVAIVMTIIAVGFFLRERGFRPNRESFGRLWAALAHLATAIWRGLTAQAAAIRQTIQIRRPNLGVKTKIAQPTSWRFIRLNALSPREQLRYFYLSTVRRASERGVEREGSETPLEYAQDLKENWPDSETDVELLTDAFLQARYSAEPIDKQDVNPVKQHWKRLRARLRPRRLPPKSDSLID